MDTNHKENNNDDDFDMDSLLDEALDDFEQEQIQERESAKEAQTANNNNFSNPSTNPFFPSSSSTARPGANSFNDDHASSQSSSSMYENLFSKLMENSQQSGNNPFANGDASGLNPDDLQTSLDTMREKLKEMGIDNTNEDSENMTEEEKNQMMQNMKNMETLINSMADGVPEGSEGDYKKQHDDVLEGVLKDMNEKDKEVMEQFASEINKFFESANHTQTESNSQPSSSNSNTKDPRSKPEKQKSSLNDTINETLNMLKKGQKEVNETENKQSEPNQDVEGFMKMFESMMPGGSGEGGEAGEGGDEKMFGVLEKMMETLMSPEVLHEPMKQLNKKYPKWLEDNQGKATQDEYNRIKNQFEYSTKICRVYEEETFPQSLPTLVDLMKEMQSHGQPPEDIVKELEKENDGESNLPNLPNMPNLGQNCGTQ